MSINPFDAAIYLCLMVAIIAGFRSGLLRSLATIFGYLAAAPLAVATAPQLGFSPTGSIFLRRRLGWCSSASFWRSASRSARRAFAVSEIAGPRVSIPDRAPERCLARFVPFGRGAGLDFRPISADRQPWFLAGSQLRPSCRKPGRMA